MSDNSDFYEFERLFLALGDKTRLRLLALMADGPVAVGFLADNLGESQPKVSRHLAYLRNAGVVNTERDGKWIYYGICYPNNPSLRQILENVVRVIEAANKDHPEYVYIAERHTSSEDVFDSDRDTYAESHIYEPEDIQDGGEWRPQEMEIFLL